MADPAHGRIDTANKQWLSPSTSTCMSAQTAPMANPRGDLLFRRAHPHGADLPPRDSHAAACGLGIVRLQSNKELATAYEIKIPIPVSWPMRGEPSPPSAACAPNAEVGSSDAAHYGTQRPLKLYTLTSVRPPVSVVAEPQGTDHGEEPPFDSSLSNQMSRQHWQPMPTDELLQQQQWCQQPKRQTHQHQHHQQQQIQRAQQQQEHPTSATQFRRVYSQDGLSTGTAIDGDADVYDTSEMLRGHLHEPICPWAPTTLGNTNASESSPSPLVTWPPAHSRQPRAICGTVTTAVGPRRAAVQQMPRAYWGAVVEDVVGEWEVVYSEERTVAPPQSGIRVPDGVVYAAPACRGAASRPGRGADGFDGSYYLQQPNADEADESFYQTYDEACARQWQWLSQRQMQQQQEQEQAVVPKMSVRLGMKTPAPHRFTSGAPGVDSSTVAAVPQATGTENSVVVASAMAPARSGQQGIVPGRKECHDDQLLAAEAMVAAPETVEAEAGRRASMTCYDWDLCSCDGSLLVAKTVGGGWRAVRGRTVALDRSVAGSAGALRMPDGGAGAGASAGSITAGGGLCHDSTPFSRASTLPSPPPPGSLHAGPQPLQQQHHAHDALRYGGSDNQRQKQLKLYPLGMRSAKSLQPSLKPPPPAPLERCRGHYRHPNSQVRRGAAADTWPQQHELPDAPGATANASTLDIVAWDLEPPSVPDVIIRVVEESGGSGDGHGAATERSEGSAGTNIEPLTLPGLPLPPPQKQQHQDIDRVEELPLSADVTAQLETVASQAVQLWMHGHSVMDDIDIQATVEAGRQSPQVRLQGGGCRGEVEAEAKAPPHGWGLSHRHRFGNEMALHRAVEKGRGDVHGDGEKLVVDLTADTDDDDNQRQDKGERGGGAGGGGDVRRSGELISREELYVLPEGHGLPLVLFGGGCRKRSRPAGAGRVGIGGERGEGAFPDEVAGRRNGRCSGYRATCFTPPKWQQHGQQTAEGRSAVNDFDHGEEEESRSMQYQWQQHRQQRGRGRRGRPPLRSRGRRGGITTNSVRVVGPSPGLHSVLPVGAYQQAAPGLSPGTLKLGAEPLPLGVSETDMARAPSLGAAAAIVDPGWHWIERGDGRPRDE